MSQPPVPPNSGSPDAPDEPRPRPSWGHPGPAETTPDASGERPSYGQPGQPSYGQPGQRAFGQPGHEERRGQPSWPNQQDYGQQEYGSQYGQQQGQPPYGQSQYGQQHSQPAYGSQPSASQYGQDLGRHEQAYTQMYGEKPRTGMAIASLVLGILAFLTCWAPIGSYAAVIMALLAVIFGIFGVRRTSGRGMAIAGLILGGIALVVSVLASIFWTTIFVDAARVAQECSDQDPSLGATYEQCVTDRTDEIIPFQ